MDITCKCKVEMRLRSVEAKITDNMNNIEETILASGRTVASTINSDVQFTKL